MDQQHGWNDAAVVSHTMSNTLGARTVKVIDSVRYITIAFERPALL